MGCGPSTLHASSSRSPSIGSTREIRRAGELATSVPAVVSYASRSVTLGETFVDMKGFPHALRMDEYQETFAQAGYIDLPALGILVEKDLRHIGVTKAGHIKKLLKHVSRLERATEDSTRQAFRLTDPPPVTDYGQLGKRNIRREVVLSVWDNIRKYGEDGMGDKPAHMDTVEYWISHFDVESF